MTHVAVDRGQVSGSNCIAPLSDRVHLRHAQLTLLISKVRQFADVRIEDDDIRTGQDGFHAQPGPEHPGSENRHQRPDPVGKTAVAELVRSRHPAESLAIFGGLLAISWQTD